MSLCGEMAADPIYSIILLGMGVDELSMSPVMIPAIKQIIRGVTWAEARRGTGRPARTAGQRRGGVSQKMMESRFPRMMSIYGSKTPADVLPSEPSPPEAVVARGEEG